MAGRLLDQRSRRFIPSERRAGCPLFSVTYIDNPARPRHGGPSRALPPPPTLRVRLVAQYLDGEARTHKGEPPRPAPASVKPALRRSPLSLSLSLLYPSRFFPSVRAPSQRSPPPRRPSPWLTRGFTIHLSPGPRAVSYSLFIVST